MQQYTQAQIHILLELSKALGRINKLADAYEDWLTDPDDAGKYYIGPRGDEVNVVVEDYSQFPTTRKKEKMSVLLARIDAEDGKRVASAENKYADPRVEMRNNMAEVRHFMELALELDDRLRQQKQMEILQKGILAVLEWANPEMAQEIARKIRRLLVVSEVRAGVA